MKDEDIRRYAGLMKELELTALEITEGEQKVRLERAVQTSVPVVPVPAASAQTPAAVSSAPAPVPAGQAVKSPMVGVFYRAPAENAEPFVKVGDSIRQGDVVGIIEAMKLMNEVVSDCDGIVEEICAENGETVDYGRVLLRVK